MNPETPYLLAGITAIAGGIARDKAWPSEGLTAVIATVALVIIASLTSTTKLAAPVRAIGYLVLLGAVISAVPNLTNRTKKNG